MFHKEYTLHFLAVQFLHPICLNHEARTLSGRGMFGHCNGSIS